MSPIWHKVRWFPFVDGMVLYPHIFLKDTRWDTPTIRHEKWHYKEIEEDGWVPWYSGYVADWLVAVLHGRSPWSTPRELRAIAAEQDSSLDSWGGPKEV